MKAIIIIPSRWKSSRFIGKSLALINNVPMLERVYIQALKSKEADNVYVATDSIKILNFCRKNKINVIKTSSNCKTGTDRVYEVSRRIDSDIYLNLQGDEPLIEPKNIDKIIKELKRNITKGFSVCTGFYKTKERQNIKKSNNYIVKSKKNKLLYISRSEIPSNYSKKEVRFIHIGIFGFTKKALNKFGNLKKGTLEINENNEILRLIENDENILCTSLSTNSISVDYPSDIKIIEKFLNKNDKKK